MSKLAAMAARCGWNPAANGEFIIMGDADDSYDFNHTELFLEKLRQGSDFVMGNRFKGGIVDGAMPPLHRYLGNPVLSAVGRLFFGSPCGDFHCGLPAFRKDRSSDWACARRAWNSRAKWSSKQHSLV